MTKFLDDHPSGPEIMLDKAGEESSREAWSAAADSAAASGPADGGGEGGGDEGIRVLLVDDFLSSGAAQEGLMRIVGQASATPIGVAVLLEKAYESGRMFLSGYDCNIESLVKVLDVENGVINVAQDDGDLAKFD